MHAFWRVFGFLLLRNDDLKTKFAIVGKHGSISFTQLKCENFLISKGSWVEKHFCCCKRFIFKAFFLAIQIVRQIILYNNAAFILFIVEFFALKSKQNLFKLIGIAICKNDEECFAIKDNKPKGRKETLLFNCFLVVLIVFHDMSEMYAWKTGASGSNLVRLLVNSEVKVVKLINWL